MKKSVTTHTLAGVQHHRRTVVILTLPTRTHFWVGIQWLDGE